MSSGISNLNIEDDLAKALQRAKQLAAVNTNSSNGQKRSISDDLNFQSAKRPNSGSNMAMANMGMVGQMSGVDASIETIEIPDNAVGLVIGRGGEQISTIQQQSGCRVQMAGESNPSGLRQCTLQGPKHSIDKARQMIAEVLDRSRTGGMGGLVGGGNGQNGSGNYITCELMIPGPKCGLIIGKSGETIKGLQESIGVKMLLIQDNQQVSMGPKPLRITGFPDKVEQAKRVVEQLMNSEDGGGGGAGGPPSMNPMMRSGPRSIGEVIVPRSSVGIIIGKGGETIKRLAQETGAKIQFKPDEDSSTPDRCAVIQGTPEQINRATQMISDLVTRSSQGGGAAEVFFMHVPANKTGLVIGKGGDTIKQICGETGAHVELSREPPPNANEKVFVIKGTPYQIHHVQHIIRIKVGDIAPGTPVPPFHGAVTAGQVPAGNPYGPTHQFGAGDQFGQAAQWAQNINPGGQDASVWAQYYNQQQQQQQQQQQVGFAAASAAQPSFGGAPAQHYQAVGGVVNVGQQMHHQQQAPQPVQQQQQHMHQQAQAVQQPAVQQQQVAAGGDAAAINPQTGQPDYSAQWAQYYRTMGMHEQAALIESQMKQQQQPQNAGVGQARPQQVFYNP